MAASGDYTAQMHGAMPRDASLFTQYAAVPGAMGYGYPDVYGYPSVGGGYGYPGGAQLYPPQSASQVPAWGAAWQVPTPPAEQPSRPRGRHHRSHHHRRASSTEGSEVGADRRDFSPVRRRTTRDPHGTPGGSLEASQELQSAELEGEAADGAGAGATFVPTAKSAPAPAPSPSVITDLLRAAETPGEQEDQLVAAFGFMPSLARLLGAETVREFASGLVKIGVAGFAGVGAFRGGALSDLVTDNLALFLEATVLQGHPQRQLVFDGLDRLYGQACKLITDEAEAVCATPAPAAPVIADPVLSGILKGVQATQEDMARVLRKQARSAAAAPGEPRIRDALAADAESDEEASRFDLVSHLRHYAESTGTVAAIEKDHWPAPRVLEKLHRFAGQSVVPRGVPLFADSSVAEWYPACAVEGLGAAARSDLAKRRAKEWNAGMAFPRFLSSVSAFLLGHACATDRFPVTYAFGHLLVLIRVADVYGGPVAFRYFEEVLTHLRRMQRERRPVDWVVLLCNEQKEWLSRARGDVREGPPPARDPLPARGRQPSGAKGGKGKGKGEPAPGNKRPFCFSWDPRPGAKSHTCTLGAACPRRHVDTRDPKQAAEFDKAVLSFERNRAARASKRSRSRSRRDKR